MKLALVILFTFFGGCNQLDFAPVSKVDDKKRIAEAQTQEVIENLKRKPEWLFSGDFCPTGIMPESEVKIRYLAVGCAGNPDECLKKCQADDANACYGLGLLLDEQRGKEGDDAIALFLRSCKLGIISGCTNYVASKSNINPNDEKVVKCAADTYEKTCSRNDSWGCASYGTALAVGLGREENSKEAFKYWQKACAISGNNGGACQSAKEMENAFKKVQKHDLANTNKP